MSERSNEDYVRSNRTQAQGNKPELTLKALLEDEVTRLVMARDGVSASDIMALARIVPLVHRQDPTSLTV